MSIPQPPISPPVAHGDGRVVDCLVCDRDYELPADGCPYCGAALDEDDVRDQVEAQDEPSEWA